jgi:hypothetical protein
MIAAFKTLSGMQKALWGLGILLTPLLIIGAVSPTPGMQKTAEVYQTTELPAPSLPEAPVATIAPDTQVLATKTKTFTETVIIPYSSITQDDPTLESGKTAVATPGVNGEKLIAYTAIYTEDRETSRIQVSEKITRQPVNELKKVGTKSKVMPAAPSKQIMPHCDQQKPDKYCAPLKPDDTCGNDTHSGSRLVFGAIPLFDFTLRLDYQDGASRKNCE